MMESLRAEESVDIYKFLKEMRSMRMHLVQTLVSIVLLHLYICILVLKLHATFLINIMPDSLFLVSVHIHI